ncbi:MAG: N-acetylmuramoyl-L-alanine amidase-like domain-containing protein [Bacteroidota bacterium]
MRLFIVLLLCVSALSPSMGQTVCTPENQARLQRQLLHLNGQDWTDQEMAEVIVGVGKGFLGTPYVAKTLELPGEEKLVVEMGGLDCTTFLENVVVLSRLKRMNQLTEKRFLEELTRLRYRDGKLAQYPSRLHYFTEWIQNNQAKGLLTDVTREVGGEPYQKTINFMSTHRDAYAQLKSDAFLEEIKAAETRLNQEQRYFIPKANLAQLEDRIQSGDLIAITTGIKGLDVVHVGLALQHEGRLHLFHASSRNKKVEISAIPLADYLMKNKSQSGIMVCRLTDPRN